MATAAETATAIATGRVQFVPGPAEVQLPERYRLPQHEFEYRLAALPAVSRNLAIHELTFPSPVVTAEEANNTVHCEYYRTQRVERGPAVVMLHILGGDFPLARVFCNALAQRGVSALLVKMPYYGPRRTEGSSRRMISPDVDETVAGMTQAILDIRRAVAWLAEQDEVDAERLGVCGISLGGITGALALANEPRLAGGCFLLAGGDLGQLNWEARELAAVRRRWQERGENVEAVLQRLRLIDPVVHAERARDRRVLMLNARDDEVIPRVCTESLWRALGEPEIVWYDGGHYSAAWSIVDALGRVTTFFAADPQ